MSSPTLKITAASFITLCLKRAWTDTLRFFNLRDLASWLKLVVPPALTILAVWFFVGPESFSKQVSTLLTVSIASFGWALLAFLGHFISAPIRIHRDSSSRISEMGQEIQKYQDAQKPRLAIQFRPQDSYVQGTAPHFLYRISVTNLSTALSIESVSVQLENIKPYRPQLLPTYMHLMNDNPIDGVHQQSFTLDPGETRYVDIFEVHHNNDGVHFAIKHIVRNVGPYIAERFEGFTIICRGKNCPSVSADFELIEQDGIYRLSQIS
jgi:hypothetical protein